MARDNELKAQIAAVNKANEYANNLYPMLAPIFEPLVGQKVLRQDGELMEKYKKLLPYLPWAEDLSVYFHKSDYSLAWVVKTCEMVEGQSHCVYHMVTVYIAGIRGGRIERLFDPWKPARTDYTIEEVERQRKVCRVAEKQYSEAKSALYPFGE